MSFFQPLPSRSPLGLFQNSLPVKDESPVDDESPNRRPLQNAPTSPSPLFQGHPLGSSRLLRRDYNRPAVLRVWGYVTGVRSARGRTGALSDANFQVHIESHDDADEVDLLQPRWFASRQDTKYPPVTLAEARRHSPLQLNRLTDHDDGSPIVRVVTCEVEPAKFRTVCFCLFDKSHLADAAVDNGRKPFAGIDVDKGMVSSDAMAEGFETYVARLRREATQGIQLSDQLPAATQAADCHIPRGRHRRQMRRHQTIESKAVKEGRSKASPVHNHTGDATVPFQHTHTIGSPLPRGRRRRQNRRHDLVLRQVGPTPSTTADHSQAGTVIAVQKKTTAVTVNARQEPPAGLPGRRRLGDEAFSALTKESVIWLKTRNPNEFDSELLVLPIHHDDGDGQNLGYLVLPKSSIQAWVDQSWVAHMTSNGAEFSVGKLFVLDKAGPSPASMKYWDKFLAEAFDEIISGLESSNQARDTAGDVMLALQTSLQNPPLVFPDSMLGALADKSEHLKIWSALETHLDGALGLATSRFLTWNTRLTNNWHYERLAELKGLHDTGVAANDDGLSEWRPNMPPAVPNLPRVGFANYEKSLEAEYHFALHMKSMEDQVVETGLSGKGAEQMVGYPDLFGDDAIQHYKLFDMTREFFYSSQYFSAIPQAYQAQITERIARIATDESHPLPLRAHATLELGICILSGFGVDRDVDTGLEWVRAAADGGSRKARAVVWRLHRSYGRVYVEHDEENTRWLFREAMTHSHWAFEELAEHDPWLHGQTLRDAVFYHPTALVATGYFEDVVKPRFDFSDPEVLREQIKKEFGSVHSESRPPPSPGGGYLSLPRPSGRFADRRRSAPVQQSNLTPAQVYQDNGLGLFTPVMESTSVGFGNGLGLVTPDMEPEQDDQDNGLGLFAPVTEPEPVGFGDGLGLFTPTMEPEPVDQDNGLGLFASVGPEPEPEPVGFGNGLGLFTPDLEPEQARQDNGMGLFSPSMESEQVYQDNGLGLFTPDMEAGRAGQDNGLGLFTPAMEPEQDDEDNGLGLFTPAREPEPVDQDNGLGLFTPMTRPETVGLGNGLGLFSPAREPQLPQTLEASGNDSDLSSAPNLFGNTQFTPVGLGDGLGLLTPMIKPESPQTCEVSDDFNSSSEPDHFGNAHSKSLGLGNGLGLFTPVIEPEQADQDDGLGLFTTDMEPEPPLAREASTSNFLLSSAPNLALNTPSTPDKYTAPGKSDGDSLVTKSTQLRPSEFFNVAFRFVCCFGTVQTLRVLLQHQLRLAPDLPLAKYIPLALAVGQGEIALELLDTAAEVTTENCPYLLFQLHHLPTQQVEPVARAIINRGFEINGMVGLHKDRRFSRGRVSVFCDRLRDMAIPEAGDYYRHWMPEIRGRSLTPLRWALYHGNEHLVRVLLDLGAEFPRLPDVEACVAHGRPLYQLEGAAFTVAVLDEPCFNINILKMFFERHGSQPGRAVFAETPLGLIVMEPDCPQRRLRFSGRRSKVENLHDVLSLMRRYQLGSDAQLFWAAAMNGHVDIVRYLVKEGVSIEARHHGQTPLHTAVLHGQKEVFRFLVDNGADIHALTSDKGMSVMHLLFWKPKPVGTELSMLDELHRLLGSVTVSSGDFGRQVQPIHLAALNSRVKALERLMELGADPTIPIEEDIMPSLRGCFRLAGWTPPETLNNNNNTASTDDKPTNSAAQLSIKGLTPAGIILARNDILLPTDVLAMLRILVLPKHPGSTYPLSRIYSRPSHRQTIFHLLACHFPLLETAILPVLLHHLSPLFVPDIRNLISLPDADGDTPLHYAALFSGSNNTRAVDRLLALGADPTVRNGYGMTPGTVRAWYFVWKGREAAAATSVSGSADVGRGGGWGEKMVQFGIPARSRERPVDGEGDGDVKWETRYWGGRTESCMRLREVGGEDGEGKEVKMMGQLLRGAKVRQVWDLHDGQWVRFGKEMVVQLVTEADMRVSF